MNIKIVTLISFLFSYSLLASSNFCGTTSQLPALISAKLIADLTKEGEHNLWSESDRHQLTFCIDDKFNALKEKITKSVLMAIEEWEQHANVTFIYMPEHDKNCNRKNKDVLFRININHGRRVPYSAKAFFPYTDIKKRSVIFKKKLVVGGFPSLLKITKHEFGHVLGFRHEHIHPENQKRCPEQRPFDPLTDYDTDSIMHYSICGATRSGVNLSEQDKIGAAIAYP